MTRTPVCLLAILSSALAFAATAGRCHSMDDFPRLEGETDDAPRFQRAVDACTCAVLTVPGGDYTFAKTVLVTNLCSIEMSPSALITAVAKMEWMIRIDATWQFAPKKAPKDVNGERYNLTYRGGTLDANGLASCLAIDNYRHFTFENATFLNGRKYGVGIETTGRGYEMIARNLYFKTLIPGLAGNTGLYTYGGDSHYTDIVVVDYTTGVHFAGRGANVLTRIHVWGGPIRPPKPGALPEMLKDSVCFRIDSSGEIIRDCYADTGEIGFWVNGWENRMFGCRYFNNTGFKMKDVTIVRQDKGSLWTSGCYFQHQTPETRLYRGGPEAKVHWGEDNIYRYFGKAHPPCVLPQQMPYNIDLGRQLFLDDALLESNTATRVWNRPSMAAYLPQGEPPRVGGWTAFYNPFTRYWEYVAVKDDGKGPCLMHTEDSELFADGDRERFARKINFYKWIPDVPADDFRGGAYESVLIGFVRNPRGTKDAGAYRFGFSRDRWKWTFPSVSADGAETTRPDGFCALRDGTAVTRPLVFTLGDRLRLNVDARKGSVGVMAEDLDGRRLGERKVAGVDSTDFELFPLAAEKPFRLRFDVRGGARLYSFCRSAKSP